MKSKVCPKCGNIIPSWAAGVCYRCLRISKDEKRFGRRGGGRRPWLRSTSPPPPPPPLPHPASLPEPTPQSKQSKSQAQKQLQPAEARYPRPHTLRGRTLTRLKGINELLETIYGEPRLISDILRTKGIEEERIQLIKRHHLEEYLDKFVDGLNEVLDNPKWDRLLGIVRYRYGIAEGDKMTLRAVGNIYGLSRERIRQLQNKAIRIMKNSKRRGRLENMAMSVAKEVLGQDSR
jgi:hypothetical protein